jgi:hypothetical protein
MTQQDARLPREAVEQKTLMRLLATPPAPKNKPEAGAPKKKRGRPPKAKANPWPNGGTGA